MISNVVRDQIEQIIVSEAGHLRLFLLAFILAASPAAEEGAAAPAGDAPADGKRPHDKHQ